MILIIDNYDSFTYNLVQYVGELGKSFHVFRNDEITLEQATALNPTHLIISPGPGGPDDAGISCELVAHFVDKIPILGVCLGHQCIAQALGGRIARADRLMHGKTSPIFHSGQGVFQGIPSPFRATRYHSLMVREDSLPDTIKVTAQTMEGEVMAIRVDQRPVEGVQFHPEAVMTEHGKMLLSNFLTAR
jgi:para-aminobenzoate synthetase component 2